MHSRIEMPEATTAETKGVYTTGEIAKLCKVAPRTVSKWFDSGILKGFRIPGSKDRRIPRDELLTFMKLHGLPLGELEQKLLVVAPNLDEQLTQIMPKWTVQHAPSSFEAGMLIDQTTQCALIDYDVGYDQATLIGSKVREACNGVLIALVDDEDLQRGVEKSIYEDTFRKPFDTALLRHRIKTLTGF